MSLQPDQGHDWQGRQLPGPGRARPLPDHRRECPAQGGARGPGAHARPPTPGLTAPHLVTCAPQSTMLQAIERYMKQAIVDKVPSVSSSALVSSLVCSLGRGWRWGQGWGCSGD